MAAETIGFAIQPEDRSELDRLVEHYGNGNRSEFLRAAIRVMAARERAERLQRIQARVHQQIGGPQDPEEVDKAVRRVVKGK